MSRIEVHWETDLLRTGKDFAVELPVAAMQGGKMPAGVEFRAPVKRQLELGPQRIANRKSQIAKQETTEVEELLQDGDKPILVAPDGTARLATDESVIDAHKLAQDSVIQAAAQNIDQAAAELSIGGPPPGAVRTPVENAVQGRRGGRGKSQAAK